MKRIVLFLFVLLAEASFAQKADSVSQSGIFMNWNDYKKGKVSFILNCSSSEKIKLNHFFAKSYVDITQSGRTIRLSKDSIFGYRDCRQKNYRFFKEYDREYEIVESNAIIIYVTEIAVTSSSGKSSDLLSAYYFSKDLNADIVPLTVNNLKKAFPDNFKFHDRLDIEFHSTKDISAYDDIHKMYRVNYLLNQTNNN